MPTARGAPYASGELLSLADRHKARMRFSRPTAVGDIQRDVFLESRGMVSERNDRNERGSDARRATTTTTTTRTKLSAVADDSGRNAEAGPWTGLIY